MLRSVPTVVWLVVLVVLSVPVQTLARGPEPGSAWERASESAEGSDPDPDSDSDSDSDPDPDSASDPDSDSDSDSAP
ncbi:MAG TPA: hypothetical protein RMH99_23325, partial [Sandaracinaceae bacterium LLY-WYZ-13_1]|nr:hypothetical protein [Sandaracinaceae bacterium LLY-WYZ-13_1]